MADSENEEYLTYLVDMDQKRTIARRLSMLQYLKEKTNRLLWDQPKNARPILEKTGIRHYFDAIVDGNDVLMQTRPRSIFDCS
jgi:beta-phosphoglucomutase